MKLLAVFFVLGLAIASAVPLYSDDIDSELDQISDELGDEFIIYSEGGLLDRFRQRFEEMVEKMKKAFDDGKGVNGDLMKKAEDIYKKINNLGIEISDKIKQIFEDLRSKIGKNSVQHAEFNIREMLRRLRDKIRGKIDVEKLKEQIEKIFGKGGELADQLLDLIKTKGEKAKNKILDLIDRILGDNETVQLAEGGLGARIKERLENLISRIKKNFDDGKGVRGNIMKKLEDVYAKFKNLGFELSQKFKSILEDLRSKVSRSSRSVENADFNIAEIFRKLKQLIKDKVDAEELKAKVEKLFGKGSELAEQLINLLKEKGEKGKNKILELIDRVLGEKEEKRSIKEVYDKIKEYFRNLNIELKEKFTKFGEYVKEQYQKVLDKSKTKLENIKKIAEEFVMDGRKISKDMAEEALEFFREYKNDLGIVWRDIRDKVHDILKKKEE